MSILTDVVERVRALVFRRSQERELAEELRFHVEMEAEYRRRGGASDADAHRESLLAFGGVERVKDDVRDARGTLWLEDFVFDVRFAVRQLRRAPGFAIAGALTLALGIGANTAVFSVVNAVVLRPLPFHQAERLVSVVPQNSHGHGGGDDISYPNFFDFRGENRVFSELVSYRSNDFTLAGSDKSVQLRGEIVARSLFGLLGVQPILGRDFMAPDEDAGARVVILSYALWTTLGSDPRIVEQSINIDGEAYQVVGVAPRGFNFPVSGEQVQLWTPLSRDARSGGTQPVTRQRGARMLSVIGRLRDGVSLGQAQAQMDNVAASLVRRYPDENKRWPAVHLQPLLDEWVGPARDALLFLLGAVGLVLLLACANIANLLLSRTAEREREFALRAAIGAGRSRIVRQVIAESVALALLGSAAGILTAALLLRVGVPLAGAIIPRIAEASIDHSVVLFSLAVTAATSLLFSLAPVARLSRRDLHDPIKQGGHSQIHASDRLRGALVVVQIALGLTLVSAASLLTASYVHLTSRDPGFDPQRLLMFSVSLPGSTYPGPRRLEFYDELLERLRNVPGATAAAAATPLPLTESSMTIAFDIAERPASTRARPTANVAIVTPEFFRTAGIPLLGGRQFTKNDEANSPPVLIVNRAFAEAFFPGENAVGKRIEPGVGSGPHGPLMREIVGVVGNARQSPLGTRDDAIYYFPYRQLPWCCPSVMVRSEGEPAELTSAVRSVVASIDKQLPVFNIRTGEWILASGVAGPRFLMLLLGSFAAIGLLLTAVGVYGVMNYGVVKRTREIGVRMALGASQFSVVYMVLRQATSLVAIGLLFGTAGALAGTRIMRTILFGIEAWQPVLLIAAILVVIGAALLATYLPARRAASVDPTLALRSE